MRVGPDEPQTAECAAVLVVALYKEPEHTASDSVLLQEQAQGGSRTCTQHGCSPPLCKLRTRPPSAAAALQRFWRRPLFGSATLRASDLSAAQETKMGYTAQGGLGMTAARLSELWPMVIWSEASTPAAALDSASSKHEADRSEGQNVKSTQLFAHAWTLPARPHAPVWKYIRTLLCFLLR